MPFTTRLDEQVLALAERLALAEQRSVTSVIEIAVPEYFEYHGAALPITGEPKAAPTPRAAAGKRGAATR
jgi:hypothetical protein